MKIVILDGYSANPGDLSWKPLEQIGALTVYDRTKPEETIERAKDAEIVLTAAEDVDKTKEEVTAFRQPLSQAGIKLAATDK